MTRAAAEPPCPPAAEAYRLEDSVGHLLRRAHQRHAALFQEQACGGLGLTPTQFATLLKLAELGRATQNRLGRLVAMDPATIQGVVQRLVARGLIGTARDPLDRRTLVLAPTAAGRALLDQAVAHARRANEAMLACLSPEERTLLLGLLRRLGG